MERYAKPFAPCSRGYGTQYVSSFLRMIDRATFSPQIDSPGLFLNRNWLSGTAISTYQPLSSRLVRHSQIAFQSLFRTRALSVYCASFSAPSGLVAK